MKYRKHLILSFVIFFSVLGGYLLSYANFSKKIPENLTSKNEVYAQDDTRNLASNSPEFTKVQEVFRAVPSKVLPSVVQINVSSVQESSPIDNPLFRFFGQPENAPKQKYRQAGLGSGTIIKKEGRTYYVLTNNHVVKDAEEINISTYDEKRYPAEIIGNEARVDLAIVKFEIEKNDPSLRVADMGNSSALRIGDMVMAIGSPDGLQSTVTQGIVSYIGRRGGPGQNINDFIQTDASINRGNSGGPLVNMDGQIVGINTWIASDSGSSAGLGFAIPIDNAKFVIDTLLKNGKLEYGWLGVTVPAYRKVIAQFGTEVEREIFEPMGLYGKKGSFITDVSKNSPAEEAGIKPGDFITELNDEPIDSSEHLTFVVGILPPGAKTKIRLIRSGKEQQITVTLGKRKPEEELLKATSGNWPGLTVLPLSKTVNKQLETLSNGQFANEETGGLLILSITPNSAVQVVGMQEGDVITEINGQKVRNLIEFYRELNKRNSRSIVFTYKRKGYELESSKLKN